MGLYQFQRTAVEEVLAATERRVLLVSPTGTGKTEMMKEVARQRSQAEPGILLVHRIELQSQAAQRFMAGGVQCGIFPDTSKPVTIAMVQTIRRRMNTLGTYWRWAMMDEAHRDEFSVAHRSADLRLYGFTATPRRANGAPMADWFDRMIVATNYTDAINGKFIVPARVWAPDVPDLTGLKTRGGDFDQVQLATRMIDNQRLTGNVAKFWVDEGRNDKTIVFAVTVDHAYALAKEFKDRGVETAVVHGETPATERATVMARFRAGSMRVLINVAVYIEGLDVGDASLIVLARPTKSLVLYLQMVGRGCRIVPGKSFYRVFDHAGNRFMHGHPSMDRDWFLTAGEEAAKKTPAAEGVKYCQKCFYVFSPNQKACPQCTTPNTSRPVKYKDGTLIEVPPDLYNFMPGLVDPVQRVRKKAFAEALARKIPRDQLWRFVNQKLQETVALQRGTSQIVVPKNPLLLW